MEDEILRKLSLAKTEEEGIDIINSNYPNWLVISLERYSTDYPHLQRNWKTICDKMKTVPKKIILVSDITFDEKPTILNKIAEFMTLKGYAVRRSSEFVACPVCEAAIPDKDIWNLLKDKNLPVPSKWLPKCQHC